MTDLIPKVGRYYKKTTIKKLVYYYHILKIDKTTGEATIEFINLKNFRYHPNIYYDPIIISLLEICALKTITKKEWDKAMLLCII